MPDKILLFLKFRGYYMMTLTTGSGKSRVSNFFVFFLCICESCFFLCVLSHFFFLPYKIGNKGWILDFKVSKEPYQPA